MSVIVDHNLGWVLDHQKALDSAVSSLGHCSLPEQFAVHSPFLMDTEFLSQQKTAADTSTSECCSYSEERQPEPSRSTKKKRKRKAPLNEGELEVLKLHSKVVPLIQKAYEQLVHLGRTASHFINHPLNTSNDNNTSARKAALVQGPGDTLVEMSELARDTWMEDGEPLVLPHPVGEAASIFNTLVSHEGTNPSLCPLLGGDYLIPARSRFLMSDISRMDPLVNDERRFDLIVLDPPWENRSVKRKKKYSTLSNWDLLNIPLKNLSANDAVVVVWVTNRSQHQRFVKEVLFPKMNVDYITEWYWLKVTTSGELVCALEEDSLKKKPYETLMLGRAKGNSTSGEHPEQLSPELPKSQVLLSVPSSLHSRKPSLHDILKPYVPEDAECLEMFARNLVPGWTSWGNEVLKFQHVDYFNKIHKAEPPGKVNEDKCDEDVCDSFYH